MRKMTPLSIWEDIRNGYDMDKMRSEIPLDLQEDFDIIHNILMERFRLLKEEIYIMYENTKDLTDKDLGLYMSQHPEAFRGVNFPKAHEFLFRVRKGWFDEELKQTGSLTRAIFFDMLRPNENVLIGYKPSSSL